MLERGFPATFVMVVWAEAGGIPRLAAKLIQTARKRREPGLRQVVAIDFMQDDNSSM
jgi:hypothetical protein